MASKLGEIVKQLFEMRNDISVKEAEAKALKDELKELENKALAMMELEQTDSIKVKGVGLISSQAKNHFSLKKEMNDKMLAHFLGDPQLQPNVKQTVAPSTFKALMKNMFEKENKVPDYCDMYSETVISYKADKLKEGR